MGVDAHNSFYSSAAVLRKKFEFFQSYVRGNILRTGCDLVRAVDLYSPYLSNCGQLDYAYFFSKKTPIHFLVFFRKFVFAVITLIAVFAYSIDFAVLWFEVLLNFQIIHIVLVK